MKLGHKTKLNKFIKAKSLFIKWSYFFSLILKTVYKTSSQLKLYLIKLCLKTKS